MELQLIPILAIFFGIVIAIAHYFSDKIHESKRYKIEIMSLGAGISLAYLLLVLLPELYEGVQQMHKLLFLFVLFGALSFHLIEKYIYQHAMKKKLIAELSISHSISFFIYHFIIGVVLVSLLEKNIVYGILLFAPILSYTAVGQVSLKEIHAKVTEKKAVKVFLSCSTLIGVVEALIIGITGTLFYALLGFVAGAMLYHVMRESIPSEKDGNPIFFLIGTLAYALLIMFIWSVLI